MEPTVWKCYKCGNIITNGALHCPNCGEGERPIYPANYCMNKECQMYLASLADPQQHFCKICNGPTLFHKKIEDLT